MKKLIPVFLMTFLLFTCSKERVIDDGLTTLTTDSNRMLMLKIDFQSLVFEGGTELFFDSNVETDTIPMEINYVPPGDIGRTTVVHIPTNDTIFDGTIIWMGLGVQNYPAILETAQLFEQNEIFLDAPLLETVQEVTPYLDPCTLGETNIAAIWSSISGLEPVQFYMEQGASIGLVTYRPSDGPGDPADWDYFLMLYL